MMRARPGWMVAMSSIDIVFFPLEKDIARIFSSSSLSSMDPLSYLVRVWDLGSIAKSSRRRHRAIGDVRGGGAAVSARGRQGARLLRLWLRSGSLSPLRGRRRAPAGTLARRRTRQLRHG